MTIRQQCRSVRLAYDLTAALDDFHRVVRQQPVEEHVVTGETETNKEYRKDNLSKDGKNLRKKTSTLTHRFDVFPTLLLYPNIAMVDDYTLEACSLR